ncbi:hypothetical protein [Hungatella hathewayi]|uniref:hypothetical protein n=1 Tax=Hungatella hathewayi TaxID=154046 RepID=UPI002A7FE434|nr:hypothetical protein [Hungatella hathewayi]
MLYIEAGKKDREFFEALSDKYSDIIVTTSKNFDGNSELIQVAIILSPLILKTIDKIIHEIVTYMSTREKVKQENPSEIIVKRQVENDKFEIVIKSSEVTDIEKTVDEICKKIKKL